MGAVCNDCLRELQGRAGRRRRRCRRFGRAVRVRCADHERRGDADRERERRAGGPARFPAGSTSSNGTGSFGKPCEAKGNARLVELSWNGKYDDKGAPSFRVVSKAAKTVLYGRLAVYFYDKAGKQIDVKEAPEGSDKTHAFHTCSGNVFAGGLNAAEKATYNFSCMGKSNIPEGMASMEVEAFMVGFADASIKKNEFYWKNADLSPDARPKGGVK